MTPAPGGEVRLLTLGCRLNQAESDETVRALKTAGLGVAAASGVPAPGSAAGDVVVVNTCTVTSDASKSSRKLVRRAVESGARVVVTGCYAVAAPETWADEASVVAVVANKDKDDLAATVAGLGGLATSVRPPARGHGVVRQAFKVQTGCDEGCTFCIIPRTRGALASRDEDTVVAGIRAQVEAGAREVALTGVHLGKYGLDTDGRPRLAELVGRILAEVHGLGWLRLSSIECGWVDDALLAAMDDPRVCAHLHIPLQSGSDATLAGMGRPYTTAEYREAAARVRASLGPDAGLTTDLLVGFPGETDAHFADTLAFVEEMAFTKLHVFRYSPRPGTPAAECADRVPEGVKKERSARLRRMGDRLAAAFSARFVGRDLQVMVERAGPAAAGAGGQPRPTLTGTAANYLKVTTSGSAGLVGAVVTVRVSEASASGVSGDAS